MDGGERRANIVHYRSTRYHKVTKTILKAEVYAPLRKVDVGVPIRDAMNELLS